MTDDPEDDRRRWQEATAALAAAYDLPIELLGDPCPRCGHPAGPDHLVLVESPLQMRVAPATDADRQANVRRIQTEIHAELIRCADLPRPTCSPLCRPGEHTVACDRASQP